MSQPKHTTGPWAVCEVIEDRIASPAVCSGYFTIAKTTDWLEMEERKANAHIIAAAPDMLEALELLIELKTKVFYQSLPEHHQAAFDRAIAPAEQAVSKAKGGSNG